MIHGGFRVQKYDLRGGDLFCRGMFLGMHFLVLLLLYKTRLSRLGFVLWLRIHPDSAGDSTGGGLMGYLVAFLAGACFTGMALFVYSCLYVSGEADESIERELASLGK